MIGAPIPCHRRGEEFKLRMPHSWPHSFTIRLSFGGMQSELTYRIEPKTEYTEVSAMLTPLSKRYGIFWALTFGHIKRNYEVLLVNGLANLKEAVEGTSEEAPEPAPE